jgi:hypothetical protein
LKEESQRKKTTIPRTEMSYSRLRIISSAAPAAGTDAVIALSDPRLGPDKILSLGVVSERNIWRNDYRHSLQTISQSVSFLGTERIWLAPSCSLLHVPFSLGFEQKLNPEIKSWLAFAEEKLIELAENSSAPTWSNISESS